MLVSDHSVIEVQLVSDLDVVDKVVLVEFRVSLWYGVYVSERNHIMLWPVGRVEVYFSAIEIKFFDVGLL